MNDAASVRSYEAHSPRKVLAHGELLRRFAEGRQVSPVHLRLGITADHGRRLLATGDAMSLLRQFAAHGGRAVTFHGSGECTLHPGYPAVCDAGHESGLRLGVFTDGSRLHRPEMAECVASTHTWVRIEFSAATPTSYLEIIGKLRQSAIDPDFRIGLNYAVGEGNPQEYAAAALAARDAGAHYIRFSGRAGRTGAGPAEAAALATETFEVCLPSTAEEGGEFHHCHYSRFVTTVAADGTLYPCPQVHLNSRYSLGNTLESGYADVLHGGPRARWEAADPRQWEPCRSCRYRPQNALLEQVRGDRAALDRALGAYALEVPSTLHADFV